MICNASSWNIKIHEYLKGYRLLIFFAQIYFLSVPVPINILNCDIFKTSGRASFPPYFLLSGCLVQFWIFSLPYDNKNHFVSWSSPKNTLLGFAWKLTEFIENFERSDIWIILCLPMHSFILAYNSFRSSVNNNKHHRNMHAFVLFMAGNLKGVVIIMNSIFFLFHFPFCSCCCIETLLFGLMSSYLAELSN